MYSEQKQGREAVPIPIFFCFCPLHLGKADYLDMVFDTTLNELAVTVKMSHSNTLKVLNEKVLGSLKLQIQVTV